MTTWQSYTSTNPDATIEEFKLRKKTKKRYFQVLRDFGYFIRSKVVHRLIDHVSGQAKFKCHFDVELAIDAVYKDELVSRLMISLSKSSVETGHFQRGVKLPPRRFADPLRGPPPPQTPRRLCVFLDQDNAKELTRRSTGRFYHMPWGWRPHSTREIPQG